MSSETNCITPSDQPITLLAPPCTQLFGPDCVIEILYSEPSKMEPRLEHRFLRCTLCGTQASATTERQDWCATMQRPKSECGCRIIQVECVSVLFYQDFNHDDGSYHINTLVKTDAAMVNVNVAKAEPFSHEQFDSYVGEQVAQAAIKQACDLGFKPIASALPDTGEAAC